VPGSSKKKGCAERSERKFKIGPLRQKALRRNWHQISLQQLTRWALPTERKRWSNAHLIRAPLIIEDEPLIALGLEAQLRELGFKACDIASDGRQALSHALNNRPNVAVVEVNLEGGREGIEVARILRERSDVPIVFVTGCTNSETIEHIRSEVPGAPVLPKPL
jgi:CheY-like chemotaxis protein